MSGEYHGLGVLNDVTGWPSAGLQWTGFYFTRYCGDSMIELIVVWTVSWLVLAMAMRVYLSVAHLEWISLTRPCQQAQDFASPSWLRVHDIATTPVTRQTTIWCGVYLDMQSVRYAVIVPSERSTGQASGRGATVNKVRSSMWDHPMICLCISLSCA